MDLVPGELGGEVREGWDRLGIGCLLGEGWGGGGCRLGMWMCAVSGIVLCGQGLRGWVVVWGNWGKVVGGSGKGEAKDCGRLG